MTAFRPVQRLKVSSFTRGFTLIELSIVLFIGASFLMAITFSMHSSMLQLRSKSMAKRYQIVQTAALAYVDVFRSLLTEMPADCALPVYQADSPLMPTVLISNGSCSLQLDNSGRAATVMNALQPTIDELQLLGFMDKQATAGLLLERDVRVYWPTSNGGDATKAPERLAILVRKVCESPGCTGPVVLESVTYNIQPYLMRGGHWLFDRFDQVYMLLSELGDGGAMSQEKSSHGNLEGAAGDFTYNNPVRASDKQGLPGIVALRSRVSGSLDGMWARRDGQSQITGDWRFGSHDIREVANLDAQTVQAGQLRSSGNAEFNTTTAQRISVDHLYPQNIRLPYATLGQACDPQRANLALDSANGRLLTCNAIDLSWKIP